MDKNVYERISITITKEQVLKLRELSQKLSLNVSAMIRLALYSYMESLEKRLIDPSKGE